MTRAGRLGITDIAGLSHGDGKVQCDQIQVDKALVSLQTNFL